MAYYRHSHRVDTCAIYFHQYRPFQPALASVQGYAKNTGMQITTRPGTLSAAAPKPSLTKEAALVNYGYVQGVLRISGSNVAPERG